MSRRVITAVAVAGAVAGAVMLGCDRNPTSPDTRSAVRVQPAWVSGAAAAALNAEGAFVFPRPTFISTSPERADTLTLAHLQFWRDLYGDDSVLTSGSLEEERTAPIRLAQLRLCARHSYYVLSYAGSDLQTLPDLVRQYFGPQYAVTLCTSSGEGELAEDVADAPGKSVVLNGRFVPPWSNGNELMTMALMPGVDRALPVSPEQAVQTLALAGGPRIDSLPIAELGFGKGGLGRYPSPCIRWHLHLARAARVLAADLQTQAVRDLYVMRDIACAVGSPHLEAADAEQPTSVMIRYPLPDVTLDSARVTVQRPVNFHAVTLER